MADLEKVIRGLECCSDMDGNKCAKCPYSKECEEVTGGAVFAGSAHLCADALSIIKAQEPVMRTARMGRNYITWTCGNCGSSLAPNNVKAKFCSNCGRAVKWDD